MKKKHLFLAPILALGFHSSAIAQNVHPSLQKTATKINTAADYISMVKLDGDMAAITQYLELGLKMAKKNGAEISDQFNAKDLLRILGLNSLKAAGSSAKELDNAWINHSYLENGGVNTGIFSLIGKSNQDYTVPTMCPAGTDLAIQLQVDLRKLPPMLAQLAKLSDTNEITSAMEENIPELNMTPTQLLSKLNVTVNIAVDINTDEKHRGNPLALMATSNAIVRIDGLNWLWEKLGDQMIAQSGAPLEKSEKDGIITYNVPVEMRKKMMGYTPQLIIDNANGHIWISSKPEFYAQCKSGENSLASSPKFKAAMEHLPAKGNSLMYLSKGLLLTAQAQYDNAAKNNMLGEDYEKVKELLDRLMVDITESDKGWAMALSKDDDGVLLASRGPVGLQHLNYLTKIAPMMAVIGTGYRSNQAMHEAIRSLPAPEEIEE